MTMPTDIGIVDLMLGLPILDPDETYAFLKVNVHDRESKEDFKFPVEYMFRGVPHDWGKDRDPVEATLEEMDRWGVEKAMMGVRSKASKEAMAQHPDRFVPSTGVDPNRGMEAVRDLVRDYETYGIKAAQCFPAGLMPQVDINDKKFFPLYAKCCELGIPFFVNAGVPGPRVPMHCQHVEHLDEVCWYFPELTIVTMHGCEPWEDLMVKLMLKWPGLHYCTSAFAPKYYPRAIIDYANTRGTDKVMYAGYFPMGLSLERIFRDMPDVPFRDHVWPKFLRENALRVFKLEE
ncbi:MAG: amidohydrolase family protein [Proteobacteria bacterium]|nr:amidohydrolase family protein [Pseudomonadota bacterium]